MKNKNPCPPFDPRIKHNLPHWSGDHCFWSAITADWMVRDSPVGVHYKLYANLTNNQGQRRDPATVTTLVINDGPDVKVPDVQLTPERPWALMGVITVGDKNVLSYKEATSAERDEEWKKCRRNRHHQSHRPRRRLRHRFLQTAPQSQLPAARRGITFHFKNTEFHPRINQTPWPSNAFAASAEEFTIRQNIPSARTAAPSPR